MYGHLGDMGWSDADEAPTWNGTQSLLLLTAAGAYWGSLWLLSGLAPIAHLALNLSPTSDRRLRVPAGTRNADPEVQP